MAPPFTRIQTFTAGTPITHEFLNEVQDGYAPAAAVAFNQRVHCIMRAAAGNIVVGAFTCMVKDATTSKYVSLTMPATSLSNANYVDNPGTFDPDAWVYAYAVCSAGVGSIELTAVAPLTGNLVLDSTNTRRYLGCAYFGASTFRTMDKNGREYLWPASDNYFYGGELTHTDWSTTSPINHDLATFIPPTAQWVDVLIDTLGAYNLTLSAKGISQWKHGLYGDPVITKHRFYIAGSTLLTSTASGTGLGIGASLRALGFVEE